MADIIMRTKAPFGMGLLLLVAVVCCRVTGSKEKTNIETSGGGRSVPTLAHAALLYACNR